MTEPDFTTIHEGVTHADEDWYRLHVLGATNGSLPQGEPPRFIPASEFLKVEFPDPEPFLGERGSRFLARGALFMVFGDGGTGKSTWTIDGIAHMAAGRDWLDIKVHRPMTFCFIENEGHPGFLQESIEQKVSSCTWGRDWLANVSFYSSPWGQFTYTNAGHRVALRDHCMENEVDVVVSNPLLGVGASGSGKPEETAAFVELLKNCGLWRDLAFWLIHHENKAGQISGDWRRHADTIALLERDGTEDAFKLTWDKPPRMGGLGDVPRRSMLRWVKESKGFTVHALDPTKVSDDELRDRIDSYLRDHPGTGKTDLIEAVEGNATRLRSVLKTGLEEGHYHSKKGANSANLIYRDRPPPKDGEDGEDDDVQIPLN